MRYDNSVIESQSSTKRLLLVGGSSSLGKSIMKLALEAGYEITQTSRDISLFPSTRNCTSIQLDLGSKESIDAFLEQLSDQKFSRIIFLAGKLTERHLPNISHGFLADYYGKFVTGMLYVMQEIKINLAADGNILALSSRAANHPSYDFHYSAAKGALQAFVMSFSKFMDRNQSIVAIAPSLIENTSMYRYMSQENVDRHRVRAGNYLLELDGVASFIWNLTPSLTKFANGRTLEIGNDY